MVNHSLHFVDPQTGVHTNNIESTWKTCKIKIKQMAGVDRKYVQEYLDEFVWRYSNYADRDALFDCIIPIIVNFYESVDDDKIDENDLDYLSDVSDMSEDEEEQNQRKEFVKNQRLLREQENEEDCSIENDARNDSIATDQILLDQTKIAREKNHLLAKQKKLEKQKAFEDEVENIISNLTMNESFTFSRKLTVKQRQIVHEISSTYADIQHISDGDGKNRQIKVTKISILEQLRENSTSASTDGTDNDENSESSDGKDVCSSDEALNQAIIQDIIQLSSNFERRIGLRERKPIKYSK